MGLPRRLSPLPPCHEVSGERVIALAGVDTLGVSAFVQFASLEQIDSIAVSGSPSQAALQPFLERGILSPSEGPHDTCRRSRLIDPAGQDRGLRS